MREELTAGDPAPEFTLPTGDGGEIGLASLRGNKVVLFFYPKDDTPGCTKESIAFSLAKDAFEAASTTVIGVSADSIKSHTKFAAKHELSVTLASDEGKQAIEAYGVWVEKNMYGRKYMGIERATFLIDADGKLARIWRKVKVSGHVEAVLQATQVLD